MSACPGDLWERDVVHEQYPVLNGSVRVPDGPGLGLTIGPLPPLANHSLRSATVLSPSFEDCRCAKMMMPW